MEHLRAYLLQRTNHRAPSMIWKFKNERERLVLMPFINARIAHDLRSGVFTWAQENDGGIELIQAASINWKTVGQQQFN